MHSQHLAEAIASHYSKILDSGQSHAENVRSHLRELLLSATRAVLQGDESWMAKATSDFKASNHDLSMAKANNASHLESSTLGNTRNDISERSIARMQACLDGCAIALPEVDKSNTSANTKRLSQSHGSSSEEMNSSSPYPKKGATKDPSHDFYLASALSGFSLDDSATTSSVSKGSKKRFPQMSTVALVTRLTLYFRTLKRVQEVQKSIARGEHVSISDGECVLAMESPSVLQCHISLLVQSFVATTGCVSSMRTILTNLLSSLTMQLLAVSTLSESIQTSIRDMVLAYEHLTCFASLAFLSTPKESAESKLAPLVRNYLEYLRSEWKNCVSSCQLELFLSRSLDPHLRHTFKTIEFQSITHLLEVCRYHKDLLENIPLVHMGPTTSFQIKTDESSIKQALRDLRREVITVNGRIIPPVSSLRELVKTLKSILNARTFKLKESRIERLNRTAENPELESSTKNTDLSTTDDSSETEFASSGNEGDADESKGGMIRRGESGLVPVHGQDIKRKKSSSTLEAIDVMTRRLIVAASRSEKGGDAYFVVRDLFGDESVDIVPVSQFSDPILSWMRSGDLVPRGSIEFFVRLSSIVIKVHANFYVYPKHGRESDPLIQLSTTTTETIFLQEVRVDENSRKVMLTEKSNMSSAGRKILAIRPTKYERVENGLLPN